MLFAEPTPMGAGIILWGDYNDLRSLYDTVERASDAAPPNLSDFLVALNYDIRHAYEHRREEKAFGRDEIDQTKYLGERILWPYALVQASLVRYFAGFFNTTREDQANIYRLEYALEQALLGFDAEVGAVCVEWLARPLHLSKDYLTEFIDEVTHQYLMGKGGKSRFKKLPDALRRIHQLSPEYRSFKSQIETIATKRGVSPHEVKSQDDLPKFKW